MEKLKSFNYTLDLDSFYSSINDPVSQDFLSKAYKYHEIIDSFNINKSLKVPVELQAKRKIPKAILSLSDVSLGQLWLKDIKAARKDFFNRPFIVKKTLIQKQCYWMVALEVFKSTIHREKDDGEKCFIKYNINNTSNIYTLYDVREKFPLDSEFCTYLAVLQFDIKVIVSNI